MRPGVARTLRQWEPERLHEPALVSACQRLLSALLPVRAIGNPFLRRVARSSLSGGRVRLELCALVIPWLPGRVGTRARCCRIPPSFWVRCGHDGCGDALCTGTHL